MSPHHLKSDSFSERIVPRRGTHRALCCFGWASRGNGHGEFRRGGSRIGQGGPVGIRRGAANDDPFLMQERRSMRLLETISLAGIATHRRAGRC